jgi:hypothetical protein
MAIDISEFAKVSVSVSPVGVQSGNFGILGFLTKSEDGAIVPISPAERARSYTSLAGVGTDWTAVSEVYKAATAFYSATPTPTNFTVIMNFTTPQKASLSGGPHSTIEEIQNVTSGDIEITIDGILVTLNSLNFSGASTFQEAALVLETGLDGVVAGTTVVYANGQFNVFGVVVGSTGRITHGIGTAGEVLGLEPHQALASEGVSAETPNESLAIADASGIEFIGLVTHVDFRDVLSGSTGSTTLEIAQWAEAAKKIFCNTSNDLSTLATTESDIISLCFAASLRYTLSTYSGARREYPSAAIFGRAAGVNFAGTDTTITLNLKQINGITSENLTKSQFANLDAKNGSVIARIGQTISAYTSSKMASGTYLDTVHGLLWLENHIETDIFNLLYVSATKLPYTQSGINIAEQTLEQSLEQAVVNGLAAPGFLPDGTYLPRGYDVTSIGIADVSVGDKSNRHYAGLTFRMVGAGAIHGLEVSGSFQE